MALASISSYYRVPARLGATVDFAWPKGKVQTGQIVGAQDAYIVVDFDGSLSTLHPTWNVTYREESQ
jgi:hypothetical protein